MVIPTGFCASEAGSCLAGKRVQYSGVLLEVRVIKLVGLEGDSDMELGLDG